MKANDEAPSNLEPTSTAKADKNEEQQQQPPEDESLESNAKRNPDAAISDTKVIQGAT